jgi:hypothetical protein
MLHRVGLFLMHLRHVILFLELLLLAMQTDIQSDTTCGLIQHFDEFEICLTNKWIETECETGEVHWMPASGYPDALSLPLHESRRGRPSGAAAMQECGPATKLEWRPVF